MDIKISGIKKNSGKVVVEIFTDKSSWLEKPYRKLVMPADEDVKTFSFSIPYGKYSISVYQDINTNGEPDMNFLGIPKEPVGFGNNYKPFGEPKFESALIEYSAKSQPKPIALYRVFKK